ncbi:hypothetical protein ONE63_001575 [Megalurothrips usitatus]|uniref:Uncharacterized protein n=1 Tax=Megalurothrips usitatus TaxID=439358 RepID=A0AAV7XDK3_9NEOP|nr:hypothetical protein ONE63_001575 [Megalurothrips usitatus]
MGRLSRAHADDSARATAVATTTPSRGGSHRHHPRTDALPPSPCCRSQGRRRQGGLAQRQLVLVVHLPVLQEAAQGADGLHRPPAADAREELREAEVPERAGPHGAGRQAVPHRHPGQDLVPEPQDQVEAADGGGAGAAGRGRQLRGAAEPVPGLRQLPAQLPGPVAGLAARGAAAGQVGAVRGGALLPAAGRRVRGRQHAAEAARLPAVPARHPGADAGAVLLRAAAGAAAGHALAASSSLASLSSYYNSQPPAHFGQHGPPPRTPPRTPSPGEQPPHSPRTPESRHGSVDVEEDSNDSRVGDL